jgi:electron transfer flavoprotein alpha subunit
MEIAIFAETTDKSVCKTTKELFTLAKRLAKTSGSNLAAILLTEENKEAAYELIQLGASRVYILAHCMLGEFQIEFYATALKNLFATIYRPDIVLFGHTDAVRSLVPYLAVQLQTGACLDCVDVCFDVSTREFYGTHSFYGGNVLGCFITKNKPQIFTIRQGCTDAANGSQENQGEIIQVTPEFGMARVLTKVINTLRPSNAGRLEDATVIIGGGRGIGGAEGFTLLAELANILGGVVGASRSAVDAGWIEPERQIGLTGKFVNPNIYIAIGISGATQHMTGCSRAKTIIAINNDPEAPVFQRAHYGVVADYKKIVPAMIRQLKSMK